MKKLILLSILIPMFTLAQSDIDQHYSSWNTVLLKYSVNNKFYFTGEANFRRTNFLSNWQHILIIPLANYVINETVEVAFGYSYSEQFKPEYHFNDNNVFEQLFLKHNSGKSGFSHRFRFEQRFIDNMKKNALGDYEKDGSTFATRYRYKFNWTHPLFKTSETKSVSVVAYDEIYISAGKAFEPKSLNQNYFYVGLAYPIIPRGVLEIGYLDAFSPNGVEHYNDNHILQTTFKYNLN